MIARWIGAAALLARLSVASTVGAQVPAAVPSAAARPPVQQLPPVGPGAALWAVDPAAGRVPIAPRRFVIRKDGVFAGRRLRYTVTAADTVLRDTAGEATGSIFSFSYVAEPRKGDAPRPVLFIFNGGPGSSSMWLHLGLLGPRKVAFRDVTPAQVPPFRLEDNPDSLLAVADLVFVDPVGTGFSRYWGKGKATDFYGTEEDAASIVQFVSRWLDGNHRWDAPKFLLGESYGTTRVNLLSRRLMGGFMDGQLKGIALNGVILVGGDGGLARPEGNDAFLVGFTTQAATAWYHGRADRAGRTFDRFIADAEGFARDALLPALAAGPTLDPAARRAIAARQAGFVGLPIDFLVAHDLRVSQQDFQRALLADKGEVVGTYDTRYVLPVANSRGDPVSDDAAMGQYTAVFAGALNTYLRDELGIDIPDDYVLIDWVNVNLKWNYHREDTDAGADLAAAMRRNPDLRLMTAEGWFDLFGAVGGARYGIAQRHLPADRVTAREYWSGHMCYVGEAGVQMASDLKDFIVGASIPRPRPPAEDPRP